MTKCLSVLVAAIVVAASGVTYADEPAFAEAKRRMAEGATLAEKGDFEAARIRYSEACTVLRTFNCVRSLAAVEYRSGHVVEAFDHFEEAIHDPKFAGLPESVRLETQRMRDSAYGETSHIVVTAPEGASIYVDGRLVGVAPIREAVSASVGAHAVEAVRERRVRQELIAARGVTTNAVFRIDEEVDAGPPPRAIVAPAVPVSTVPPASSEPAHAPHAGSSARVVTAISLAGAGAIGLGIGIGFMVDANNADSRAHSIQSPDLRCSGASAEPRCGQLSDALHTRANDHEVGGALLATGGALAAGAALVWFLWPTRANRSAAVIPIAGGDEVGLSFRGTY